MCAYSFKIRFVEPIRAGTKTQTIRNDRKRHARPGELVQLYHGMRTRSCFKIVDDPRCETVTPIRMQFKHGDIDNTAIFVGDDRLSLPEMNRFAVMDGFLDLADMAAFWRDTNGVAGEPKSLVLIRWR